MTPEGDWENDLVSNVIKPLSSFLTLRTNKLGCWSLASLYRTGLSNVWKKGCQPTPRVDSDPMFIERKVCYSALFTNLIGWHASAVSFPPSDIILAQLACPLSDVMFYLNSRRTNLFIYKNCSDLTKRQACKSCQGKIPLLICPRRRWRGENFL
jgi:hypothetical protein